ncbi:peptidoglycan DD-metalloendopeptidase family protein [Roseicyclus sp. F158]|uniref:Peptidoglycan DD-metalloendopeptidase family protein n=1 Tax=Tropicimonas omnivorans TaxID=3075590 RepID=A0ABU3DG76_9RHOB|nr:peptidoglycan DD-metalloendopeptidase family protein [Roseicyclus sp. F158]MDT0682711.1 peptidoglycan DD-metalloendopeptidase family protein [Roseicyclus sp. F158]
MRHPLRSVALGALVVALGACGEQGPLEMFGGGGAGRNGGAETTRAATVAPRPDPDARGIISYPSYQMAVARRGDTVGAVAQRVGLPAQELADYNGVPQDAVMNPGAVLALPRRVAASSVGAGGQTGAISAAAPVQVTTLAGNAIDRAESNAPAGATISAPGAAPTQVSAPAQTQTGKEPVRHRVQRGETAYSIARRYNVSVSDLASWNGLDGNLTVREGQFLMIPVAVGAAPQAAAVSRPGEGSPTPTPPSAAKPLPQEEKPAAAKPAPEATPASPKMDQFASEESAAQMARPVAGSVIRDFAKGKNDGIDISAPAGAAVKAADSGTVAAITQDTDQVPIIVIRHSGGLLTVYANVDQLEVQKGDTVSRGQTIAKVRAASPSFLHFEVRKGVEAVDPGTYLN